MKCLLLLATVVMLVGCSIGSNRVSASKAADSMFEKVAAEYVDGYLAWRPQTGTSLGLHEYDGKVTDLSRPSLDKELARLKSFERQLSGLDVSRMTLRTAYDYRLLLGGIRREIFAFEEMEVHSKNPMTYASV